MLIKSSAKTAEIDCSWRNQFELSQKPYNGYYYDSQFWKRFSEHTAVYLFQSDAFTLLSCPENLWHKIKHFQPSELERKLITCNYSANMTTSTIIYLMIIPSIKMLMFSL